MTRSLVELAPALLASLGVDSGAVPSSAGATSDTGWLPAAPRVLLVLVDGLGWAQLDAASCPWLATHAHEQLRTVFPSTTASALASLTTGAHPGQHALVGYTIAVPGSDLPLNLLSWAWGPPATPRDARDEVPPERLQPLPTVFEHCRAAGLEAVAVGNPEFAASGLTRAVLRGARYVGATGPDAILSTAADILAATPRGLVYAYIGAVDAAGHAFGPASDEWLVAAARTDAALDRQLPRLPAGSLVVVTADHGMVATGERSWIELEGALEEGVRVVAGEPRCRQLHVRPGAVGDVVATYRELVGDRFDVLTREEAAAAGWFGPAPDPHALQHVGDVLVVSRGHHALVHRHWDPAGGRLRGMHGARTDAEVVVPLAVEVAG